MIGTVDYRSILATQSLSNIFIVSFWEIKPQSVFFLLFFTEKGLVLHFYSTVKTRWSLSSDNDWYNWLQEHPGYSITHYQTFLLYHFGEISVCVFLFFLHQKRSNITFLLECNITLVHKFWQWLVQLTSGASWLLHHSLSNIFTVSFLRN